MLKCKISFDTDKIINEGEYSLDVIQRTTDILFAKLDLKKGENGFYYGSGAVEDFTSFMTAIWRLTSQDWFMHYIKEFLWYNPDNIVCPENVIKTMKKTVVNA